MVKGVFFDLYDTLIITSGLTASGWLDEFYTCLHGFGLNLSKETFSEQCEGFFSKDEPQPQNDGLTVYERRIKDLCARLGIKIGIQGIRQTATNTIKAANENCYLDPDCHTVLGKLRKNKTLVLVSNFDHAPHIKNILREMDLDKYFRAVIISEEVGLKKPDPGIFHMALRESELSVEEVIHVGDSLTADIAGALAAGIRPVLIRRISVEHKYQNFLARYDHGLAETQSAIPGAENIITIRQLTDLIDIVE
jgi:putative hydrolase of the HAD superfamily